MFRANTWKFFLFLTPCKQPTTSSPIQYKIATKTFCHSMWTLIYEQLYFPK